MLCYWFTSNIFSLGQVLTLKIPAVRQFFKIPQIVKHTDLEKAQTKKKGFTEGFKDCRLHFYLEFITYPDRKKMQ